jgi:hypothetical protein
VYRRVARGVVLMGGVGLMKNTFLLAETPQVRCVNEPEQAVTQVVVTGRWGGALRSQASQALRACVAETPRAVLADVARLDDPAGESASTWQTASRYAAESRKPTEVIVCASSAVLRSRLLAETAGHRVAVADSVDAARLMLGRPAAWNGHRRHHLSLAPQRDAPVVARMMAGDACVAFDLVHLIHPARLIVSELAGNAVAHARTDFEVEVSVRGPVLHLAVWDREPRLPRVVDPGPWRPGDPLVPAGSGLRVVADAATAWGALPCPGGKVIWATLALDGGLTA